MNRKLLYKLSCNPDVMHATKDDAFGAAIAQCRTRGEPLVLMGVGADGAVREWEIISTQRQFDIYNQRCGALITLIDPPQPRQRRSAERR